MMFFVPAILFMPLGTVLVTAQTSLAEPAADECKTKPGSSAPPGRHWYYLINRTDQRRCWFLGPEGATCHQQRGRCRARMLLKRLAQYLRPWNSHKGHPSKPHLPNHTE
jgi:hypothetical protein